MRFLQRWPCSPLYCNHREDCGEDRGKNTLFASPVFKFLIYSLRNIYSGHRDKSLRGIWLGFSLVELKLGTRIVIDTETPGGCFLKALWEGDKVPYEYHKE